MTASSAVSERRNGEGAPVRNTDFGEELGGPEREMHGERLMMDRSDSDGQLVEELMSVGVAILSWLTKCGG